MRDGLRFVDVDMHVIEPPESLRPVSGRGLQVQGDDRGGQRWEASPSQLIIDGKPANASKTVLPGLAHIPQIDDAQAFVAAVLPFLESA